MATGFSIPGNPVRTYTQTGVVGAGQFITGATCKDAFPLVVRTGISAADTPASAPYDPTVISPITTSDATWCWISAACTVASQTIDFVLAMYDVNTSTSVSTLMQISEGMSVSVGSFYKVGSLYLCSDEPLVADLQGAGSVALIVTGVSGGSWTLYQKFF